jgi:polyvinyl alcohol dehydrogenase (cytochrome)
LLLAPSAQAAEGQAYAAAMTYATPVVALGKGDTLKFTNLDPLASHDLASDDGKFASDVIPAGQSSPVRGVEGLAPGAYPFHCTLHTWMRGVVNVAPVGAGGATPPSTGDLSGAAPGGSAAPDPIDLVPQAEVQPLGDGEWPLYGRDVFNTRDGGKAGPAPAQVPSLGPVWSFHSPHGDFTGTPVVADKTLVAGTNGGFVIALNATTGKVKWTRDVGAPINGSAAIAGGRVVVPVAQTHSPRVVALDLVSGRTLWDRVIDEQKDSDVYGSPTIWDGTVYIGVSALFGETGDPQVAVRGSVNALDLRTGRPRWKTYMVPEGHDGGSVWTTPAVDPQTRRVYVGTGNAYHEPAANTTDSIVALDADAGGILDHFQATANDVWNGTENVVGAGPDYDFGASPQLFAGPGGRRLVGEGQKSGTYWALDRDTMDPVWSAMTAPPGIFLGGIIGSTATDGDRIYGPDTIGGEQWAIDEAGGYRWFSSDGGPLHFNATSVANGVVYNTDMTGHLNARDAASGLLLGKIPLGSPSWAGVAVAGGSVFTATGTQGGSGYLVAYRPRSGFGNGGNANEGDEPRSERVKRGECTPTERVERGTSRKVRSGKARRRRRARRARRRVRTYHDDGVAHPHGKRIADTRTKNRSMRVERRRRTERVTRRPCTRPPDEVPEPFEDDPHAHGDHGHSSPGQGGAPTKGAARRFDRYVPKPAGTKSNYTWYFGPYEVPPGHDMNRADIEIPAQNGFMVSVEPSMRRVQDLSEPSHMEGHIHHAHWFAADPGNKEDNYTRGNTEWIFGNGDEETKGDFQERTDADPNGPVYGQFIRQGNPQLMIYMLHNKTAAPLNVYIVLDVTFIHGTADELKKATGREHHDVSGILFGETYDVPRDAGGDGVHEYAKESGRVEEWTSTVDGTIIGMGGHLHPGGISLKVENYGREDDPCADDGKGYGGTTLFDSDAIFRRAPLSEDFQMEVTHPGFRAPIRKGDRIRISATYENKDHAWYAVMEHLGIYVDEQQPPEGKCTKKVIGVPGRQTSSETRVETKRVRRCSGRKPRRCRTKVVRTRVEREVTTLPIDPEDGVFNRPWRFHPDPLCGPEWGRPCELPEDGEPRRVPARQVTITNFSYQPGNRTAGSSAPGEIATIRQGESLVFVNADQPANIRHTVTTCPWPCNGPYVGNYPLADGRWDSDTLGYDLVDGGNPNPRAETPKDLPKGKYAYFCRIHPWMRGAFAVE